MAGLIVPTLIVVGVFGLIGVYLYVVSRFIHESERPSTRDGGPAPAPREQESPSFPVRTAHAH
jgi:hypothetical protein